MGYYDYPTPEEQARRDAQEAQRRLKSAEALRRYWANITPEEREERRLRANETRRRNAEAQRQREEEQRREVREAQERRAAKKLKKEIGAFGPPVPDVTRVVPGGQWLTTFRGIPRSYVEYRASTFWRYVDQSGGPEACWPWHGARLTDWSGKELDYGMASWHGRMTGAHRVAWMLHNGWEIPGDVVIDHMCECTWCVQPLHLLATSMEQNSRFRRYRPPEYTRERTSFGPPWNDRWYPFGRRKYDAAGNLKPEYREERKGDAAPLWDPLPEPIEPIDGPIRYQLLDDDEEF